MLEAVPAPNDPPHDAGGWMTSAAPRALRAACDDCGAHASAFATDGRVRGTCSVCGSRSLTPVGVHLPPPANR